MACEQDMAGLCVLDRERERPIETQFPWCNRHLRRHDDSRRCCGLGASFVDANHRRVEYAADAQFILVAVERRRARTR